MEKHNISVLISEEEVQKRVRELAAQISKDYEGESFSREAYFLHVSLQRELQCL